jgi:hypothetical protein
MILVVVCVTIFSSLGLPQVTRISDTYFVEPVLPLPLSFPFYAYVFNWHSPPLPVDQMSWTSEVYSLDVLGVRIHALDSIMHPEDALLFFSFFLLVNIVGAIIGYWISKSEILERLFRTKIIPSNRQPRTS